MLNERSSFFQDCIPISSKTPEYGTIVMMGCTSLDPVTGYLWSIATLKTSADYEFIDKGESELFDPTHWMPLPDTDCLLWE